MRAPDGPARGASVAKSFVELVDPLGHGHVAPIVLGSAVRGRFLDSLGFDGFDGLDGLGAVGTPEVYCTQ